MCYSIIVPRTLDRWGQIMVDVSHYFIGSGQRDSSLKQKMVPGQPSCLWLLYRDTSGVGKYASSLARQKEKAWFWRLGEGGRLMAYTNSAGIPSCSGSQCLQQCPGPYLESCYENGAEPGGQNWKNNKQQSCLMVMSRSLDQTTPTAHSKSEKLIC